jgi:hypothetical protein
LGVASAWSGSDGNSRIDGMINGMIKAHSILSLGAAGNPASSW